jgi:hypothetical protein
MIAVLYRPYGGQVLVWVDGTPQAHLTGDMIVDSISGAKTIEVRTRAHSLQTHGRFD